MRYLCDRISTFARLRKGTVSPVPLFSVPHTSHFKIAFSSPEDPSSRLPQSVQKTSDPIAAIVVVSRPFKLD